MNKTALCLVLAFASISRAAIEFVWCPLFDRGLGTILLENNNIHLNQDVDNLPDAKVYGANYEGALSGAIGAALKNAYNKGVRVIDLPFLYGGIPVFPGTTTPVWPKTSSYWGNEQIDGFKWLAAVENFNSNPLITAKLRLRIRFRANVQNLWVYTSEYLPNRSGAGLASVTGLPATQDDFGAWQGNGLLSKMIPDLSNPKIRQAIGVYAKNILTEARSIAKTTTIESMTLVFDGGDETSLLAGDTGENMPYGFRSQQPFSKLVKTQDLWKTEDKIAWFKTRTQILSDAMKEFATQVHTQNSRFDNTGATVKAGLFFQDWPGDGYYRGAFDFSSLLDGTGIDIIHHSMHPIQLTYYSGESVPRTTTQDDAAIQTSELGSFIAFKKRKSNVTFAFDAEYSWPWYPENDVESYAYDSRMITDKKATGFHNQAIGSIRYGANATTFCNWTRYDMEKGLYRPSDPLFPTNSSATAFDAVLSTTAKTSLGSTAALGTATRAIYVSTVGKMLSQIRGSEAWTPVDAADFPGSRYYKNWFRDLAISPFNERVDIITDKMLQAYPSLLSDYTEIFFPYETSGTVDMAVFKILDAASDANKAKIKYQMAKNDGTSLLQSYAMWKFKVRVYNGFKTFDNGLIF